MLTHVTESLSVAGSFAICHCSADTSPNLLFRESEARGTLSGPGDVGVVCAADQVALPMSRNRSDLSGGGRIPIRDPIAELAARSIGFARQFQSPHHAMRAKVRAQRFLSMRRVCIYRHITLPSCEICMLAVP